MCWPEQALICLRYGVEISEGSLMGQNNTEEKCLPTESVWKRCPLHLVRGFPGQGTSNRLRLPSGLMTPETHTFLDLIFFPSQKCGQSLKHSGLPLLEKVLRNAKLSWKTGISPVMEYEKLPNITFRILNHKRTITKFNLSFLALNSRSSCFRAVSHNLLKTLICVFVTPA